MFAEKYGEVVLLSHTLSLFPTDAGVETSFDFLLIDGPPNIMPRMKLQVIFHSCLSFIIHHSYEGVKKKLLLPILVFLACLHTLPLVLSPPPDPVCVVHKWLRAPCCFASATFSRCCSITVGVQRRFNAHTLCQWVCHT